MSSHSLWDKPSAATLEAEEDLRQFTEQRLEDVRSKKKLNLKKVRLRQTLQDKYRDQEMLLQKQVCLGVTYEKPSSSYCVMLYFW